MFISVSPVFAWNSRLTAVANRCHVGLICVSDCCQTNNERRDGTKRVNGFKIVWKETRTSRRNSLGDRATASSTCGETRYSPPLHLPNPACTEAVSLRRANGHFEVGRGADGSHRLNAFMTSIGRFTTVGSSGAVRYWRAAESPRDCRHVRKPSHTDRPATVVSMLVTVWDLSRLVSDWPWSGEQHVYNTLPQPWIHNRNSN